MTLELLRQPWWDDHMMCMVKVRGVVKVRDGRKGILLCVGSGHSTVYFNYDNTPGLCLWVRGV